MIDFILVSFIRVQSANLHTSDSSKMVQIKILLLQVNRK